MHVLHRRFRCSDHENIRTEFFLFILFSPGAKQNACDEVFFLLTNYFNHRIGKTVFLQIAQLPACIGGVSNQNRTIHIYIGCKDKKKSLRMEGKRQGCRERFAMIVTTRVARATTVGTRILRVFLVFMIVVLSKLLELGEEVASVALGL
mgnify:CR=1 FL=1